MWMLRKSNLLEVAKYVTAIVTVPATYHVFFDIFKAADRGIWLAGFTAVCSIILIDVLLLYFLYILEEDTDPLKKWPDAIGAIALAIANIAVGIVDEGILAWVPRVGLITLVSRDVFRWALDYWSFYNSYEAVELRLRNKQKTIRRKVDHEEWKVAMQELRPDIRYKQLENEIRLRQLDRTDDVYEDSSDDLVEVGDNVFKRKGVREYLWSKANGELIDTTATGKPYLTLRGAKQARTKYLNAMN